MSTQDKDKGWNRILDELDELKTKDLKVGIQRGTESAESDELVSDYAYRNEFGIGVPERSFMRSTIDENRTNYNQLFQNLIGQVIDDKKTVRQSLGIVGEKVRGDISHKIVRLRNPPNAPITIERKRSSNPLIDTGQMRQSIQWVIIDNNETD